MKHWKILLAALLFATPVCAQQVPSPMNAPASVTSGHVLTATTNRQQPADSGTTLRTLLTAPLSLWVRPSVGSDSNNCTTLATACATQQGAANIAYNSYDSAGQVITIKLYAPGETYSGSVLLNGPLPGGGSLVFNGNSGSAQWAYSGSGPNIKAQYGATFTISNVHMTNSGSATDLINAFYGANVILGAGLSFGNANASIFDAIHASIIGAQAITIDNATVAQSLVHSNTAGMIDLGGSTITCSGTATFSQYTVGVGESSAFKAIGTTYPGCAGNVTEPKFTINRNSSIRLDLDDINAIPGSTAGTFAGNSVLDDVNSQGIHTQVLSSGSSVTLATNSQTLFLNSNSGVAKSVSVPGCASATTTWPGKNYDIIDEFGDAGTNNITITPTSGTINNAATYVINQNGGWVVLRCDGGTNYTAIISSALPFGSNAYTSTAYAPLVSPSFTTPSLGVATATTINKVTVTPPATGSTLTIADGKTLTANNTLIFSGTDGSTLNIGAGGTLGTAAYQNTGTSGANIPFLNGTNTWANLNTFGAGITVTGGTVALNINSNNPINLGTGTDTSNINLGNTGNLVNIAAPISYGGVTLSNAVTGTGNMVLATSPTISNLTGTGVVTLPLGSVSAPSINFATANTGIYGISTGSIAFTSAGTQRFLVNGSGGIITGSLAVSAAATMPGLASSSAAQTGTICWTTSTGNLTVDTTTTCLLSLEETKNILPGGIDPLEAMKEEMKLKPFWFSYKPGGAQTDFRVHAGLGAHQVESVDKRLVGYDPKGKLQGVRYADSVTSLNVAAIKGLITEVTALKAANDNLTRRIAKMEHK